MSLSFINICKFDSFKNTFPRLLACLNFPWDSENLLSWHKQKNVTSINYDISESSWKPWKWVNVYLTLTIMGTYISSSLNQLLEFKNILPWSISHKIMSTFLIGMRIVLSYTMKEVYCFEFDGNDQIVTFGGKFIVEQILASEEINKSESAGILESLSGIRVRKLTI